MCMPVLCGVCVCLIIKEQALNVKGESFNFEEFHIKVLYLSCAEFPNARVGYFII